jgi:hypothetical protein
MKKNEAMIIERLHSQQVYHANHSLREKAIVWEKNSGVYLLHSQEIG